VVPVAEDAFRLQMSISREFRDEVRGAQDLLRHRVPDGDLAKIFRAALKLLVSEVKKERAHSSMSEASAVRRERRSRSITSMGSRARIGRTSVNCGCSAARTTSTPRTGCMVAHSWMPRGREHGLGQVDSIAVPAARSAPEPAGKA
jgi:hypothetical protein